MNQKIWDLYAPVYEKAMRLDRRYYQYMYDRIPAQISGKEVLEIATGPGRDQPRPTNGRAAHRPELRGAWDGDLQPYMLQTSPPGRDPF